MPTGLDQVVGIFCVAEHLTVFLTILGWKPINSVDSLRIRFVHQTDFTGDTNLRIVTTNNGRQFRGSPSIDHSLPIGVSAQTAVKTLSGWSGAWR
ncbi:hypothetical protein ACFQHW_04560 [Lapidilactobacillus achengensis]|uniref:Uncharacterized protein n=1 Tax=Lapidilactobacillus achengensis TaxID=2486000 RepID=A0ABW1ULK8_9LACO|nr:hypothetical protein [Lapidilactobacillus achengensis]